MRTKIFIVLTFLFFTMSLKATQPPFLQYLNDEWVNEQVNSLSLEEKIAQLFTIAVYPNQKNQQSVLNLIEKYNPGGVIVMQGAPCETAELIKKIQQKSKVPTLISIDGEWGIAMRIDSVMSFPYAQALGAVKDSNLLIQMGRDMAAQMKLMGIHMNYAPIADINTNPENPVINFRSFGEKAEQIGKTAWYIAKGMQEEQIIAVAKHFPGHGNTSKDSHKTLPSVNDTKSKLDDFTTQPFRYLFKRGITSVMTGHLNVPAIDPSGTPASLSKKITTDYLQDKIGFNGFVITDAINMAGAQQSGNQPELKALLAGNDHVEFVTNLPKAINDVKNAVQKRLISVADINVKLRKTLALKKWVGLDFYEPKELFNLSKNLNSPQFKITKRKLIQTSLTVLNNNTVLPIEDLSDKKIASVMVGSREKTPFQEMLGNYTQVDHFNLGKNATGKQIINLRKKLESYDLVIVGINNLRRYPYRSFGISQSQQNAVYDIVSAHRSIVVLFGNVYALKHFKDIHHSTALIAAYQDDDLTQELSAQMIFGAFGSNGKLPVTIDKRFKAGAGVTTKKLDVLGYSIPEMMHLNTKMLHFKIDSIAQLGIDSTAYPGCQVLIAKNGAVVFHKTYGFHTYNKKQPVTKDDIYDWASVTKVTAPLPALMQLVDKKKINIDAPFSRYWKDFRNSNKNRVKFREVLAHQARFASWIPFWKMTVDEGGKLDSKIFQNKYSNTFNIKVSNNLFLHKNYIKTIYDTIRTSELLKQKRYVYSGLSFYIYPQMISNLTGESYENYLQNHFYKPLGATTVGFNPYKRFSLNHIVPTENDDFFRKTQIHGFVHDEGAAMMGGISGNAGLFGTANDLAKIFQMYLQMGSYGGKRYIKASTMKEFTTIQYPKNDNRRGLGFDKPYIDNYKNKLEEAYPAYSASEKSFGHSGYTGTFVWADPESKIVYIFMSNRVYPTRKNSKLYELNIRTAIHQAIYDSIL